MKKVFIFAAVAAACLLAGCQKENNAPAGTTLTASILETRTAIQDNVKVLWSAGDQINVNGVVSKAVTTAGATASFQFDAALTAPYKAVYPASGLKGATTLTLPAELAASDGTFAEGAAPMLAIQDSGTELHFFHVVSYIRVPVKSSAAIESITFSGNAGEQVCGDFEIEWNSGQLMKTDATEANQSVKVLVGKSAATVVIPVPSGNYERGYKLTAIDANGKEMTYIKPSYVFLNDGQINTLPEVVFEPVPDSEGSGTEADPYLIRFPSDLQGMSTKVVKGQMTYFKMMDNIDMSSITEWTPVNVDFANELGAEGFMFDGNHKVISNWHYVNTTSKYPGFVAVLHGEVKDVVFADCVVENSVGSPCGLVCGWNGVSNASLHGHIENVHAVRCQVISTHQTSNVGGIAGSTNNAEFINCSFNGVIERRANPESKAAYRYLGGLIGQAPNAGDDLVKVENCSVSGSIVSGNGRAIAGLIGGINAKAIVHIKNCHVEMDIQSKHDVVGGLVGYWGSGTLEDCSYKGTIDCELGSTAYIGGIVAHTNLGIEMTRCHSEGTINSPGQLVGGLLGQSNAVDDPLSGPAVIRECWSTMTLNGKGSIIGGLVGRSSTLFPLVIENSWYSGKITATGANVQNVGGIVGDPPKKTTITNCWSDAEINAGFGLGGICGRLFGRQGSAVSTDVDVESAMTGCIYWGPSITTNTADGEKCSNHYSSGAMIGFSSRPNTLKDNYRNPDMTFNVFKYALLNTLYDHADSSPATPLVQPYNYGDTPVALSETEGDIEDFKYYSPYNGKAAPAGSTISSIAKTIGWDETIWDLSGDYPMLKNNPVPVSNK